MPRGRPKGLRTGYCAKKRTKISSQTHEEIQVMKPVEKVEQKVSAPMKAIRKVKESILQIKPAMYAQKRKNKLKELTQGNFYKKPYRKKACQNLEEDFMELNYHSLLPLRKSLAKQIAKQTVRTQMVLNAGCIFKRCQVTDLNSNNPFYVIERPEFNPMQVDKYENFQYVKKEELKQNFSYPFVNKQPSPIFKEKLQPTPSFKKKFMPEVKKEDRIWIIVKERNRKMHQPQSEQQHKITIYQSLGGKRALSQQTNNNQQQQPQTQPQRFSRFPEKMKLSGRGRGVERGRGRGRGRGMSRGRGRGRGRGKRNSDNSAAEDQYDDSPDMFINEGPQKLIQRGIREKPQHQNRMQAVSPVEEIKQSSANSLGKRKFSSSKDQESYYQRKKNQKLQLQQQQQQSIGKSIMIGSKSKLKQQQQSKYLQKKHHHQHQTSSSPQQKFNNQSEPALKQPTHQQQVVEAINQKMVQTSSRKHSNLQVIQKINQKHMVNKPHHGRQQKAQNSILKENSLSPKKQQSQQQQCFVIQRNANALKQYTKYASSKNVEKQQKQQMLKYHGQQQQKQQQQQLQQHQQNQQQTNNGNLKTTQSLFDSYLQIQQHQQQAAQSQEVKQQIDAVNCSEPASFVHQTARIQVVAAAAPDSLSPPSKLPSIVQVLKCQPIVPQLESGSTALILHQQNESHLQNESMMLQQQNGGIQDTQQHLIFQEHQNRMMKAQQQEQQQQLQQQQMQQPQNQLNNLHNTELQINTQDDLKGLGSGSTELKYSCQQLQKYSQRQPDDLNVQNNSNSVLPQASNYHQSDLLDKANKAADATANAGNNFRSIAAQDHSNNNIYEQQQILNQQILNHNQQLQQQQQQFEQSNPQHPPLQPQPQEIDIMEGQILNQEENGRGLPCLDASFSNTDNDNNKLPSLKDRIKLQNHYKIRQSQEMAVQQAGLIGIMQDQSNNNPNMLSSSALQPGAAQQATQQQVIFQESQRGAHNNLNQPTFYAALSFENLNQINHQAAALQQQDQQASQLQFADQNNQVQDQNSSLNNNNQLYGGATYQQQEQRLQKQVEGNFIVPVVPASNTGNAIIGAQVNSQVDTSNNTNQLEMIGGSDVAALQSFIANQNKVNDDRNLHNNINNQNYIGGENPDNFNNHKNVKQSKGGNQLPSIHSLVQQSQQQLSKPQQVYQGSTGRAVQLQQEHLIVGSAAQSSYEQQLKVQNQLLMQGATIVKEETEQARDQYQRMQAAYATIGPIEGAAEVVYLTPEQQFQLQQAIQVQHQHSTQQQNSLAAVTYQQQYQPAQALATAVPLQMVQNVLPYHQPQHPQQQTDLSQQQQQLMNVQLNQMATNQQQNEEASIRQILGNTSGQQIAFWDPNAAVVVAAEASAQQNQQQQHQMLINNQQIQAPQQQQAQYTSANYHM